MNKLLKIYKKNRILRWLWWLAVIIPGVPFIFISIGLQIYMHWPRSYQDIEIKELNSQSQYLTLSAHGVNDTAQSWGIPLKTLMEQQENSQLSVFIQQHIALDWQPYSNNALLCSVAGKSIGKKLAKQVSNLPHLKGIHLIGHSCGSFLIYGFCQQLKADNSAIKVQTTYLDPVSVYSGVFWQYGVENFGRCADFSDTYIDTEDTVPGSNQMLEHSITFDVTQLRKSNKLTYASHAWPTHFYLNAYNNKQVPIYFNNPIHLPNKYNTKALNIWH